MFDDKVKLKFGIFGKKNQMESTQNGGKPSAEVFTHKLPEETRQNRYVTLTVHGMKT